MDSKPSEINSIIFEKTENRLKVLDQTLLPSELKYVEVKDCNDGHRVIKNMQVRGAPCIAAVGCLSLIVELRKQSFSASSELVNFVERKAEHLATSRPTAVNLKQALDKLTKKTIWCSKLGSISLASDKLCEWAHNNLILGAEANKRLGLHGAEYIANVSLGRKVKILTHCNTGALATVGHGTAYGVIKTLHKLNKLERAFCTETRPYNQGSRLTAWEFLRDRIPATLVSDSMVAYLIANEKLDAVIVGADRVARNGDTANKIGTLQIAVTAHFYKIPFYVATPTQSIDLNTSDGSKIKVELRPAAELRCIGSQQLAPEEMPAWNPSFDITPVQLIDAYITELGTVPANDFERWVGNMPQQTVDSPAY